MTAAMQCRFTIRDLLWLTLVVAFALAPYLERRSQVKGIELQERQTVRLNQLLDEVKRLSDDKRDMAIQRDEASEWNRRLREEIERLKKENTSAQTHAAGRTRALPSFLSP